MILLVTLLRLKDFFFPWVKKITSVTISFSSSNRNHCLEISFLWLSLYINTCIYIIHYRDIQDMNWIKESSQKDFSFQMFYFHLCNKEKILVINVLLCLGNNSIVSPGFYLLSLSFFFFGQNIRTEVLQLEGKALLRTQTEITQPASTKDLHALRQVRSGSEFNHLARPVWLPDLDSPSRVAVLQILF